MRWLFVHCIQIKLEFGNVGFWGEGKNQSNHIQKPLRVRTRTNNKHVNRLNVYFGCFLNDAETKTVPDFFVKTKYCFPVCQIRTQISLDSRVIVGSCKLGANASENCIHLVFSENYVSWFVQQEKKLLACAQADHPLFVWCVYCWNLRLNFEATRSVEIFFD